MVIRDITQISEMRTVEAVQQEVWGIEDREIFPALALIPMREVGAILIGAFDGDLMAGFVFGFPGLENGRVILHSDMLAVRPEYRSDGLGRRLKLAQRERALEKGIDTITWTFDPLQARNAWLNFGKLGVIGDRYLVNYYGATSSFLHQAGTDRLWVTWRLNDDRVKDRISESLESQPPAQELPALVGVGKNNEPITNAAEKSAPQFIGIEVPDDINRVLEQDAELAMRWRTSTREAFTKAMAAGYVVEGFQRLIRDDIRLGVYLLTASPTTSWQPVVRAGC